MAFAMASLSEAVSDFLAPFLGPPDFFGWAAAVLDLREAPDDFDLSLPLGFSEESVFMASSETCDDEEGTKHLNKAEKRAIVYT